MKWFTAAVSSQNLYLKLAIFLTGIAIGLDSSLRQLLLNIVLILLFLLAEPSLFALLVNSLRRILPFFAGYWLFATLFAQRFPDSVFFSVQIIYLVLVTVYVFGKAKMRALAWDSRYIRKCRLINAMFYYAFATGLYVASFAKHFHAHKPNNEAEAILNHLGDVFAAVSGETLTVQTQVNSILNPQQEIFLKPSAANFLGVVFLTIMVLVHGI